MDRQLLGNLIWFLGWLIAVGALFVLALRLPLQTRLGAVASRIYAGAVVVLIFVVAALANVALSLHDAQIDLTRAKVFTPSQQALAVVDRLNQPVRLTYFFQGQDPNGQRAKDIVESMGRRNPLLEVKTVDPDKEPTLAENFGVKVYNAAVLEADGRRITVRSVDESEIAIGIQRALRAGGHRVFHRGTQRVPDRQFRVPYALRRGWRDTVTTMRIWGRSDPRPWLRPAAPRARRHRLRRAQDHPRQ